MIPIRSTLYLSTVSLMIALFGVAAPSQAPSPRFFNERFILTAVRLLHSAEATHQVTSTTGDFGSLAELSQEGLIDATLTTGLKHGYRFTLETTSHSGTAPATFSVTATPVAYRKTGLRSFFIDQSGEMRGADKQGQPAVVSDPYIDDCALWGLADNERCTIQDMHSLASAEATYAAGLGAGSYAFFPDLFSAGLIRTDLADYESRGYLYTVQTTNATPPTFKIWAVPLHYGTSAVRSFFVDQTGVVRGADKNGQEANENDPPIN